MGELAELTLEDWYVCNTYPSLKASLYLIPYRHNQVARSWQDLEWYCAHFCAQLCLGCATGGHAQSQGRLNRPRGRCQSDGRRFMTALRAREWSCDAPAEHYDPINVAVS